MRFRALRPHRQHEEQGLGCESSVLTAALVPHEVGRVQVERLDGAADVRMGATCLTQAQEPEHPGDRAR